MINSQLDVYLNQLILEYSLFNESTDIQHQNITHAINVLKAIKESSDLKQNRVLDLLEVVKYLIESTIK